MESNCRHIFELNGNYEEIIEKRKHFSHKPKTRQWYIRLTSYSKVRSMTRDVNYTEMRVKLLNGHPNTSIMAIWKLWFYFLSFRICSWAISTIISPIWEKMHSFFLLWHGERASLIFYTLNTTRDNFSKVDIWLENTSDVHHHFYSTTNCNCVRRWYSIKFDTTRIWIMLAVCDFYRWSYNWRNRSKRVQSKETKQTIWHPILWAVWSFHWFPLRNKAVEFALSILYWVGSITVSFYKIRF